jgi:hypothetical protein
MRVSVMRPSEEGSGARAGAGYISNLVQPQGFNRVVREFLSG